MRIIPILLRALPLAFTAVFVSGCVGTGYLKDLNRYAKNSKGPDFGSSAATSTPAPHAESGARVDGEILPQEGSQTEAMHTYSERHGLANPETEATGTEERILPGQAEVGASATAATKPSHSRMVEPPVSNDREVKSAHLSRKALRKMERQPPDIDWGNNTSMEWFFLIMSGVGLVVGILGVGIGWFAFLVFGGLWLYRKLVGGRN